MEVRAFTKSIRISPRKMRLVADVIRNMPVEEALRALAVINKRPALVVQKTLSSAIANAVNNAKLERANLVISSVMVNEAQALKRFQPSTRGRIHAYKKRGSHLEIVLNEKVVVAAPKAAVVKEAAAPVKAEGKGLLGLKAKSSVKADKPAVKKETKEAKK